MNLFNKKNPKISIAVLASGGGSNFEAIHNAIKKGDLNAEIKLVFSDTAKAKVLEKAKTRNINNKTFQIKDFSSRDDYEKALGDLLEQTNVDFIVLAGYMKLLGSDFIKRFENRIINIHPALLPSFAGLHVQKKALDYGVKFAGCTIHFVDNGVDTGPIISQQIVPVLDNDTEETLSKRILKEEHDSYWRALKTVAEGVEIVGRKVIKKV